MISPIRFPELLISRHYSRDFEREADKFAQQLMVQHNIDAQHLSNILSRIDEGYKEYPEVSTYFSTHPSTGERMKMFQNP